MSDPKPAAGRSPYWRSLADRDGAPEYLERVSREFPQGASELELDPVSRRTFLGLMGASLALAGVSSTGCIRKPAETILPFAQRPEEMIPGRSLHYATAAWIGGSAVGLLVESQDGRPHKVEGNPLHPGSRGGATAWAQASVLDLYDPDRSTTPRRGRAESTWAAFDAALAERLAALGETGGEALALLVDARPSPTFRRLLREVRRRFPRAKVYAHDPAAGRAAREAAALLGLRGTVAVPDLSGAQVILSLDCDFLGVEPESVRHARAFAEGRRVATPGDSMNRLYAVEAAFSMTGAAADHRLRLAPSRVRGLLEALVERLAGAGASVPGTARAFVSRLGGLADLGAAERRFVDALADDLLAHEGASAVLVGSGQPAVVHALGHLVNAMLGSVGRTIGYRRERDALDAGSLAELAESLHGGGVDTLVMLGVNPAYDAPRSLRFVAGLDRVPTSIHHGLRTDETSAACSWHVPASHYLETWGDLATPDGTLAIQQPLIAPLHATRSELELLAAIAGVEGQTPHDMVRETWAGRLGADGEATWRRWLHDGVAVDDLAPVAAVRFDWRRLGAFATASAAADDDGGTELVFALDPCVYDGRYANNAWLQELPDPMTKLAWDNAACLSPAMARRLDVETGDIVEITRDGASVRLPASVTPGLADGTACLSLGRGRTAAGRVGTGIGVDVSALRASDTQGFATGARLRRVAGRHELVTTQDHGWLREPDLFVFEGTDRSALVREASLSEYRDHPEVFREQEAMPLEHVRSLWEEPNERGGQQWGMVIDLNACTGCNACAIACQAENNIPVVGRERVRDGREMHWIRLDRYYRGDEDDPQAVHQPIPCMQCENAPCEQVCPVAATSHSDDGLNDMAYNRCIGTRYCSNNCPYKVRRFNYFNYTKENDREAPLLEAQRNQNVTVRFRGVMEKCTYCVQRISEARIDAKVNGDGVVPDGTIQPACAQTCPTQAIVFGDVNDRESEVSKLKRQDRNYGMLEELNTKPRTTYLARLRNPNPALEPAGRRSSDGGHH